MEQVLNLVPEPLISIAVLDEGERLVSSSGSLKPGGKRQHPLNRNLSGDQSRSVRVRGDTYHCLAQEWDFHSLVVRPVAK
jgi:hypothetical protein